MYLTQTVTLFLLAVVLQCNGQKDRIFDGEPVGSDRFPYFAIVRVTREEEGNVRITTMCGGSLITSDAVLVGVV